MANRSQKKTTYSKRRNDLSLLFFIGFACWVAVYRPEVSWAGDAILGSFAAICGVLGIHRWAGVRDFENVRSTPDVVDNPDAS